MEALVHVSHKCRLLIIFTDMHTTQFGPVSSRVCLSDFEFINISLCFVDLEEAFDRPPESPVGSAPGVWGTGSVATGHPVPVQTARFWFALPVVSQICFQ